MGYVGYKTAGATITGFAMVVALLALVGFFAIVAGVLIAAAVLVVLASVVRWFTRDYPNMKRDDTAAAVILVSEGYSDADAITELQKDQRDENRSRKALARAKAALTAERQDIGV